MTWNYGLELWLDNQCRVVSAVMIAPACDGLKCAPSFRDTPVVMA
jgi:hypothetical protein